MTRSTAKTFCKCSKRLPSEKVTNTGAYILQSILIAIAGYVLSFFKYGWVVDLVVVFLFVQDIEGIPEKPAKVRAMVKRFVQSGVIFGLSLLFHDTFGLLGSGLLMLVLGLYLLELGANWLEEMRDRFDRWLSKKGLQYAAVRFFVTPKPTSRCDFFRMQSIKR